MKRIFKCRKSDSATIRNFRVPQINFSAGDYTDLIFWTDIDVTEPPLLANLSGDNLQNIIETGETDQYLFAKLPCYTQAVERCVKLVTEASLLVCGEENRHGLILSKLSSRNALD
jgi:hypothetical protein